MKEIKKKNPFGIKMPSTLTENPRQVLYLGEVLKNIERDENPSKGSCQVKASNISQTERRLTLPAQILPFSLEHIEHLH
jgi:hypothetical protein